MTAIIRLSELDAVNRMLLGIGKTPVNTLEVGGIRDVSVARLTLEQVSFDIQSKGHRFNTHVVTLTPRVEDNRILIPADVVSIEGTDSNKDVSVEIEAEAPTIRFLFNRDDDTFEWSGPVKAEVVRYLDWAVLPGHASQYIAAHAALQFQNQRVGSPSLEAPLERALSRAHAAFRKQELKQGRPNLIRDSARANGGSFTYNHRRSQRYA
jgi:hypothetical protein